MKTILEILRNPFFVLFTCVAGLSSCSIPSNNGKELPGGAGQVSSYAQSGSSDCSVTFSNIEKLLSVAEQGNPAAQYSLACLYYNGQGVPQDHIEAGKWFRQAAIQGDASSQYKLGDLYRDGFGDTLDYKEAVKWYTKAAELGNAEAQLALGNMYENGRGIKTNPKIAAKWYRNASEQGLPEGSLALGKLLENTKMWEKADSETAAKEYQKSAEQGDINAQYLLGRLYYRDGEVKKAAKWFRKAASQGHPTAPLILAEITITYGKNVQNPREVVKWLQKIVEKGEAATMYEAKFFIHRVCQSYFTACY